MRPFKIPKSTKTFKTAAAIDVAARYFVYKLYEVTDGRPMAWKLLSEMGEPRETALRAVERGWVTIKGVGGKPLDRSVVLTDEGRRLARRGRYPNSRVYTMNFGGADVGKVSLKDLFDHNSDVRRQIIDRCNKAYRGYGGGGDTVPIRLAILGGKSANGTLAKTACSSLSASGQTCRTFSA